MNRHDTGTAKDLMIYRLAKALRCLRSSARAFDESDYENSIDRSYYAILQAINAVHALDGNGYKRHKDAIAKFNENYIRYEAVPKKFGRELSKAMELRHYSEYEDFSEPTKEEAEHQLDVAEEFVGCVKQYIEKDRLHHKIAPDRLNPTIADFQR